MEMGRDLRNRNKQKTDRNSHKFKYATILHLQHNYYDRLFQEKYTKSRHSEIPCKGFPRLITKKKNRNNLLWKNKRSCTVQYILLLLEKNSHRIRNTLTIGKKYRPLFPGKHPKS